MRALFVFPIISVSFFTINSFKNHHNILLKRSQISMKWAFGKGTGSLQELGVVGAEGEYYFHPSKPATLRTPQPISKAFGVPIFPYNSVLSPIGSESIQVLEMQSRQLFNDVGEEVFGFVYLNPQAQKLALVGTLARIKNRVLLEDGRSIVTVEGIKRFFIKEFISDKPYIKARIQTFDDYTEDEGILDALELDIFDEVRFNVKLMELLFPSRNYTLGDSILDNKPQRKLIGVRNVRTKDAKSELARRTRLSYAILDMLQIKPSTKLTLLQEPVLEKRYIRLQKVLEKGSEYLRQELRSRGVLTEQGINDLRADILADTVDIEVPPPASWVPENYVNGEWVQTPVLM